MIRSTPTMTELRFFTEPNPAPKAPYVASCLVIWDREDVVTIRLLTGEVTMALWRELLGWLEGAGVVTVRATRVEGKHIPLASEGPDGFLRADVATLCARFRAHPEVA